MVFDTLLNKHDYLRYVMSTKYTQIFLFSIFLRLEEPGRINTIILNTIALGCTCPAQVGSRTRCFPSPVGA